MCGLILGGRLYTRAEDTLDADDLIFPRAATRVGRNYQTNVPSWEEQLEMEGHNGHGELEAGPPRHMGGELIDQVLTTIAHYARQSSVGTIAGRESTSPLLTLYARQATSVSSEV